VTARPRTRPLPDFLCIGAQKAGTTWLYRNLKTHPDVWLPPEKELHYFDKRLRIDEADFVSEQVHKGAKRRRPPRRKRLEQMIGGWTKSFSPSALRWQLWNSGMTSSPDALRWRLRYSLARPSDDWYISLFRPAEGRLTGDMTPGYAMLSTRRVAHVRQLVPDVKIIFFLRNPIERAWSHAGMHAQQGYVDPDVEAIRRHFRSAGSRRHTDYVQAIDTWSHAFPADQIFVGFNEDIRFHPRELLSRICDFLGTDDPGRWPYMTERVYGRSDATIPTSLAAELASIHSELIDELSRRFGGYADWWAYSRDRLALSSPDGDLAFPLYDSSFWGDWLGSGPPRFQSDVLVRARRRPAHAYPSA
jgi:hypothetical protein